MANAKARRHAGVKKTLAAWEGRLCTTDFIFGELATLVRYRVGHKRAGFVVVPA